MTQFPFYYNIANNQTHVNILLNVQLTLIRAVCNPSAPLVIALSFVPIALSGIPAVSKALCGVVALFAAASCFNFKHAIFPDVDFGVIHCVRGYNLLALAYAALHMGTLIARAFGSDEALPVLSVLTCVDVILILPVLKRGICDTFRDTKVVNNISKAY